LRGRIGELNSVTDRMLARHPVCCLDLHTLPGGYHRSAWSVDRLHPSELGHRLLARGFGELLAGAGFAVPHPVGLRRAGGREVTLLHHLVWLMIKGVPWLCRRGGDLVPYALAIALRELRRSVQPRPDGPGQPGSGRAEPGQPGSGRAEPGRAEPGQPGSGRAEPGRAEPGRAEPGQPAPGQPQSARNRDIRSSASSSSGSAVA
jgi:hypothetical protein